MLSDSQSMIDNNKMYTQIYAHTQSCCPKEYDWNTLGKKSCCANFRFPVGIPNLRRCDCTGGWALDDVLKWIPLELLVFLRLKLTRICKTRPGSGNLDSLPDILEEGGGDACSRQTQYCPMTLAAFSEADFQAVTVYISASSIWWQNVALCTICAPEGTTVEHIVQSCIFLNGRPKSCLRYAGQLRNNTLVCQYSFQCNDHNVFLSSLTVSFSCAGTKYFPSHHHVLFLILRSWHFCSSLIVLCLAERWIQPILPFVWAMQNCEDVL